jgi:hypothetical protein
MDCVRLLMFSDYYGIEYEINPWMNQGRRPTADSPGTVNQLRGWLRASCEVETITPRRGCLTWLTANAGLAWNGSLLYFPRGQTGAGGPLEAWFSDHGLHRALAEECIEVKDCSGAATHGRVPHPFRYSVSSKVAESSNKILSLELTMTVYHLDTCFVRYPSGAMFIRALTPTREVLENHMPISSRFSSEAARLRNAVVAQDKIVMNTAVETRKKLESGRPVRNATR